MDCSHDKSQKSINAPTFSRKMVNGLTNVKIHLSLWHSEYCARGDYSDVNENSEKQLKWN